MSLTHDFVKSAPVQVPQETPSRIDTLFRRKRRRAWLRWAIALIVVVCVVAALSYFSATDVSIVHPISIQATETLALAGVTEGRIETPVAADAQGTLLHLYVRENALVKKGQLLAQIQDKIALTQLDQANAALATAHAEEERIRAGTQLSEIDAAEARVLQARSVLFQSEAAYEHARAMANAGRMTVDERTSAVNQANANLARATAQMDLSHKSLDRTWMLYLQGALPKARYDEAKSADDMSKADVANAEEAVTAAKASVTVAVATQSASQQDVIAAQKGVDAAAAAHLQAQAALKTLEDQPRSEDLAVATAHVQQAVASVKSARAAIEVTQVRAPFDGMVTEIIAEEGAPVTAAGVLRMIQSNNLQIRLDVDESNLADLQVGQKAIAAFPADPARKVAAIISKIDAHVDSARGTVRVTVTPAQQASWLRAGQTIDVQIILHANVRRLTLPETAIRKDGDKTVAFVARKGRAIAIPITTGLVTNGHVAVLSGLSSNASIISDAGAVEDGTRIRSNR